jgi:ATP-dependent RNA helicase DBP3|eukprot:Stramenopile-MAST_4_protein_207
MSKRSGDDIFASSDQEGKRARKFWEKEVKRALKAATSPLKMKHVQKTLIKQYRAQHPSVSKEDAKSSFAAAINGSSKFAVDGKYVKLAGRDDDNRNQSATTTDVTGTPTRSAPSKAEILDTDKYRLENELVVEGDGAHDKKYTPWQTFDKAREVFGKDVVSVCDGFDKPTAIQAQSWPILVDGRDIVSIAETGSGKTLGFLLPAVAAMFSAKTNLRKTPSILVVAPTRELAMQTAVVAKDMPLSSICIYGGVPKWEQKKAIRDGVNLVVGTPGRLLDLVETDRCLDLSLVNFLVLDEADRMLDQGFEKDMRRIVASCNPKRQTALFSATWPESIQKLAQEFMKKPVHVYIGTKDLTANVRVSQAVEVVDPREKEDKLHSLLGKYHKSRKNRVLVFALYKKEAERLESVLQRKGWKCVAIHGNKTQDARTTALADFKSGKIPLLIATDVAARGLDIPNVECVINCSFPLTIEDYIHRIGRTGRAGKTGISHTFFTSFDKPRSGELINVLRAANQEVPEDLLKFGCTVKRKEDANYGRFGPKEDLVGLKAKKTTFDSDSD